MTSRGMTLNHVAWIRVMRQRIRDSSFVKSNIITQGGVGGGKNSRHGMTDLQCAS